MVVTPRGEFACSTVGPLVMHDDDNIIVHFARRFDVAKRARRALCKAAT